MRFFVIIIVKIIKLYQLIISPLIGSNCRYTPRSADKLIEDNGVKILVDKKSYLYLVGTTLNYSKALQRHEWDIQEVFTSDQDSNDFNDRFDSFIRYLNT